MPTPKADAKEIVGLVKSSGRITGYQLSNGSTVSKEEGVAMAKAGDIKGVLVFTWMPRYGVENFFGVAAIRPMVREDIVMSPEPAQSSFKSIAEWNWTNNSFTFNTDKGQRKMVSDEKILADVGTGTVHSMVGGEVIRGRDYNNVRISDGKEFGSKGDRGMVKQGAMRIKTKAPEHCGRPRTSIAYLVVFVNPKPQYIVLEL